MHGPGEKNSDLIRDWARSTCPWPKEGLCWRQRWRSHGGDRFTSSESSREYSFLWAPPWNTIPPQRPSPAQQPVDFNAVCDASGQTTPTGGAHRPTHQQTGCLNSSQSKAVFTKGPKPSSTHKETEFRLSHQEATTNLLDSFTHQRADRRSKKSYNAVACEMETAIAESQTEWGGNEGTR